MRTLGKFPALFATGLIVGLAWAPAPAFAQGDDETTGDDGGDDDLRDILGPAEGEESAAEERAQLEAGQTGDKVGARDEELILIEEEGRKKKVIKTIQRKNFLKLGRFELSPHAAFVANDPFLNRYIVGSGLGYHWTEVFATELNFDFVLDFGLGDWKLLTD
jgi:hypothetical protein